MVHVDTVDTLCQQNVAVDAAVDPNFFSFYAWATKVELCYSQGQSAAEIR